MDRTFRKHGNIGTKKYNSFTLFFFLILALLLSAGLTFGATYTYAQTEIAVIENNSDRELPSNLRVFDRDDESVFAPKVVDIISTEGISRELVYGRTVGEILKELNIKLSEYDYTKPDTNSVVAHKGAINIVKVTFEYYNKSEIIPYVTEERRTDNLNTGTVEISQEGINGELVKRIKVVYEDGIAVKSTVVSNNIIKPMQNKILLIGTKPVTIHSCGYWDNVIDRYVDPSTQERKNRWMKSVMRCETMCNSGKNTRNTYFGLYQFNQKTFKSYGGQNIYDGTDQILTVSKMYDTPGNRAWHWPVCNSRFESNN